MMLCATAALSGCVSANLEPIYYGSEATVDYLLKNDPDLLRQIAVHNEVVREQHKL